MAASLEPAVGFWELDNTGAFSLGLFIGAVDASLELLDAKNEVPPIVVNNGGVFGLLSAGD